MSYRPLPESVTIGASQIEGLGLRSTRDIPKGTNLGVVHIYDVRFPDNYIRTPLAGFINHSENNNLDIVTDRDIRSIVTNKDIHTNEELTLKYTLYTL